MTPSLPLSTLSSRFEEPGRIWLEIPLAAFFAFLAFATAGLFAAEKLATSFASATNGVPFCLLGGAAAGYLYARRQTPVGATGGFSYPYLAACYGMAAAVALLASAIIRFDGDDAIYLPKALHYLAYQDAALDRTITWIAGLPESVKAGVFPYYEITLASLAYYFQLRLLDLYYVIFPAAILAMMLLATLLILTLLDDRKWLALSALLLMLLALVAMGETHRTPGNILLARLYQAKFMFLAAGVPSWVYFSLRYFILRDLASWLILVIIGIAMAGATTTALIFLPALSLVLWLAVLVGSGGSFTGKGPMKTTHALRLGMIYGLTLLPLALMALEFRSYALQNLTNSSDLHANFPPNFTGQILLLVNPNHPLTLLLFLGAAFLAILLSPYRRFIAAWIFLAFGLFLNPLVASFIIEHLTTQNIYWRLFYLLPLTVVLSLAFMILAGLSPLPRIAAGLLSAWLCYLALFGPTSVLRPDNRVQLRLGGYKVHAPTFAVAEEIARTQVGGSMFAPQELSSHIVLASPHFPQYHIREDYLRFALNQAGLDEAYRQRSEVYRYLYMNGPNPGGQENIPCPEAREAFLQLLSPPDGPTIIVIRDHLANATELSEILGRYGYQGQKVPDSSYTLFHRSLP